MTGYDRGGRGGLARVAAIKYERWPPTNENIFDTIKNKTMRTGGRSVTVRRGGCVRACGRASEYGGLSAGGGGHVVRVDVGDVGRRRAQARAQPGRRVRRQPLLQVLQRRLERAHHAQLQQQHVQAPPARPGPPSHRLAPPTASR